MSKVLATWPGRRRASYRWERYADGRIHQLTSGEDYYVTNDRSVAQAAYMWAIRHGRKVHTTIPSPGIVVVQFTQEEEQEQGGMQ
jgi:hypothetical protein